MKKNRIFCLTHFLVFVCSFAIGQPDTLIAYNVNNKSISIIAPVTINNTNTFDKTNSNIGTLGNQVPLSLTPPTTNLINNTHFSDIVRAELFFDVEEYPIRTATRLFQYKNGTSIIGCSGIMVGNNFVLTAAHCAYDYVNQSFNYDSILIVPGYDNAMPQPTLPTSLVEKVYIFKTFYDSNAFDDIALLQLKQPIGNKIGWIGMAFNSDTNYFNGKVFHKLSYPATNSSIDTTKHYNGDTLYYNYGNISNISPNELGLNLLKDYGIQGQSGSSFFYTDNVDYYSFGVMSFIDYFHYKINKNVFYQLENVLNNSTTENHDIPNKKNTVAIYPNPFTTSTLIKLNSPAVNASLYVYNLYGQLVREVNAINEDAIVLQKDNLQSGIYFIKLIQDNIEVISEKLIVTD
jgi:hypothetical protein